MTNEQIQANRDTYLALCRKHIQRDGLEALLEYLDHTDFFTAPSSSTFHLNEAGGLCLHSINVFRTALQLNEHIVLPATEQPDAPFTKPLPIERIAVAALFHDLCKTGLYHEGTRWKKDEQGRWQTYPAYELKDDFPFGHGEKSCLIVDRFMRLHKDELLAIRWHMGMFEMTEQGSSTRYAFRAAMEATPLVVLQQSADMLAANCLERITNYRD